MRILLILVFSFFYNIISLSAQTPKTIFQDVNTSYDELNPVISADGKMLFITISSHPQNIGGKRDPGDIWLSKWNGAAWSAPVHGGTVINDRAYNAVASISPDGEQLFLLSHYDTSHGIARTQGISISKLKNGSWTKPENIAIPYFHNKSTIVSGYINAANSVFIFSAETYGTYGVEDLYICKKNAQGRWTEPKNLGQKINTQFQELSPWLSSDGNTLFFSSNGRKGFGSFDVYSSKRLDETWMNWSDPINLGNEINSVGRELFYQEHSHLGFSIYTSTINSDGYGDVKHRPIPLHADVVKGETSNTTADSSLSNEGLVQISGKVTNTKSGEVIPAKLTFSSEETAIVAQSNIDGYNVRVPPTNNYIIKIEAPGYISSMEKLDIRSYEMNSLEMNFKLQSVERGASVNLKNVLFAQASTTLLPESNNELDVVVSFLKENPSVYIELSGHTDNRGNHSDNVRLSKARVDVVKEYLVSNGIEAKRITGRGYGGIKPIASNESEETRKLNRRVEFTIKKL